MQHWSHRTGNCMRGVVVLAGSWVAATALTLVHTRRLNPIPLADIQLCARASPTNDYLYYPEEGGARLPAVCPASPVIYVGTGRPAVRGSCAVLESLGGWLCMLAHNGPFLLASTSLRSFVSTDRILFNE